MIFARDKLNHDAAKPAILPRALNGSSDALKVNLGPHDALDCATVAVSLSDAEHLPVEPEGRRLINERGNIEIAERHDATPPKSTERFGIGDFRGWLVNPNGKQYPKLTKAGL